MIAKGEAEEKDAGNEGESIADKGNDDMNRSGLVRRTQLKWRKEKKGNIVYERW